MTVDNLRLAPQVIDPTSAPITRRPPRTVARPMPGHQLAGKRPEMPAPEASDQSLLSRCHVGDQDAATQLYDRYAQRLTRLVRKRCPIALARCAGLEDIVQSVFQIFFRRAGQGNYEVRDGDLVWNLLLVIALNRVRNRATYHYAAKRDAHRTIGGPEALDRLNLHGGAHEFAPGHFEMLIEELMDRMPCRDRRVMQLRIEGFGVAHVARLAGCSTRTVERVTHDARLMLAEIFREED
jgi:RNA polymerase sigma-70 factor, ECF subfamily